MCGFMNDRHLYVSCPFPNDLSQTLKPFPLLTIVLAGRVVAVTPHSPGKKRENHFIIHKKETRRLHDIYQCVYVNFCVWLLTCLFTLFNKI